jgi:coenzyme F420-reducing hydrogenase beta subunit
MNVGLCDPEHCYGCSACANICPNNCIGMDENNEGFLVPHVTEETCTDCGACYNICPAQNIEHHRNKKAIAGEIYTAVHKNRDIHAHSSSGGVFTSLAYKMFEDNGVVCGVVFNEDVNGCYHTLAYNEADIAPMRRSKYVQSGKGLVFNEIRKLLRKGTKVLFAGTPCEVHGLKLFLGEDDEKLITVDLLCAGVSSPKFYRKYVNHLQHRFGAKISTYNFRDKTNGWRPLTVAACFNNGRIHREIYRKDPYGRADYLKIGKRITCYDCPYSNSNRIGDLTIGDFWKIKELNRKLFNPMGVSIVSVNTAKGIDFWNKLKDIDKNKICNYNNLRRKMIFQKDIREKRLAFFADMDKCTMDELVSKHLIQAGFKGIIHELSVFCKALFARIMWLKTY